MLDADTKRRIDTARDILVGKVPDPKSQVEQITIALIYKFMDDIDAQSEELGGQRTFFAGEFARYGWASLMRPGLGGYEMLNLYAEAIGRMPENPGIPPLFRDIFNNAFLPYRDPETLRAFLKIIDEFTYDHSERLGDAFEYLLSVLGSQGDAGQFRTPRHIIDFIVAIIDPKKDEVILDPACGTAGFLISSYKHILAANRDADGNSTLTPDDSKRLANNFQGYDISPDMVRLSLVNMYLHGFVDPRIVEYDTLTSEDLWNDFADVILANPPFMSPKGGIRPHNRFSLQSRRSEVLFVDYMAEHLNPMGRAGIIVPEGIIFQSQKAHTQLRKMLVEDYLVAVVSLPGGVFKPYSGVKTSILILDKALARKTDSIAFFKVENDGFDLGDQRRPISENDLPAVQSELFEYLRRLRSAQPLDDFQPKMGLVASKAKVAADDDYNLSGERYRKSDVLAEWPMVPINEIATEIKAGFACGRGSLGTEGMPHIRPMNITERGQFTWTGLKRISIQDFVGREDYTLIPGDVLFNNTNSKELVGKTCLVREYINGGYSNHITRIRGLENKIIPAFLSYVLHAAWHRGLFRERANKWIGQAGVNRKSLGTFKIPLPPLEVQKEIVAEIEGYQKVIDGARAVVDNYRPQIAVDPEWPTVSLEEACSIQRGKFSHRPRNEPRFYGGEYPFIQTGDITRANGGRISFTQTLNEQGLAISKLFQPPVVVITIAANIGDTAVLDFPSCFPDSVIGLIPHCGTDAWFLELMMREQKQHLNDIAPQAAQKNINIQILRGLAIPLPPLKTQQTIVAEIKAERALVNANRELITRFQQKIQDTIDRVWGEPSSNSLDSGHRR